MSGSIPISKVVFNPGQPGEQSIDSVPEFVSYNEKEGKISFSNITLDVVSDSNLKSLPFLKKKYIRLKLTKLGQFGLIQYSILVKTSEVAEKFNIKSRDPDQIHQRLFQRLKEYNTSTETLTLNNNELRRLVDSVKDIYKQIGGRFRIGSPLVTEKNEFIRSAHSHIYSRIPKGELQITQEEVITTGNALVNKMQNLANRLVNLENKRNQIISNNSLLEELGQTKFSIKDLNEDLEKMDFDVSKIEDIYLGIIGLQEEKLSDILRDNNDYIDEQIEHIEKNNHILREHGYQGDELIQHHENVEIREGDNLRNIFEQQFEKGKQLEQLIDQQKKMIKSLQINESKREIEINNQVLKKLGQQDHVVDDGHNLDEIVSLQHEQIKTLLQQEENSLKSFILMINQNAQKLRNLSYEGEQLGDDVKEIHKDEDEDLSTYVDRLEETIENYKQIYNQQVEVLEKRKGELEQLEHLVNKKIKSLDLLVDHINKNAQELIKTSYQGELCEPVDKIIQDEYEGLKNFILNLDEKIEYYEDILNRQKEELGKRKNELRRLERIVDERIKLLTPLTITIYKYGKQLLKTGYQDELTKNINEKGIQRYHNESLKEFIDRLDQIIVDYKQFHIRQLKELADQKQIELDNLIKSINANAEELSHTSYEGELRNHVEMIENDDEELMSREGKSSELIEGNEERFKTQISKLDENLEKYRIIHLRQTNELEKQRVEILTENTWSLIKNLHPAYDPEELRHTIRVAAKTFINSPKTTDVDVQASFSKYHIAAVMSEQGHRLSILSQRFSKPLGEGKWGSVTEAVSLTSLTQDEQSEPVALKQTAPGLPDSAPVIFIKKEIENLLRFLHEFIPKHSAWVDGSTPLPAERQWLRALPFLPVQIIKHVYRHLQFDTRVGFSSEKYELNLKDWVKTDPPFANRLNVAFQTLYMSAFNEVIGFTNFDTKMDNVFIKKGQIAFGDLAGGEFRDTIKNRNMIVLRTPQFTPLEEIRAIEDST